MQDLTFKKNSSNLLIFVLIVFFGFNTMSFSQSIELIKNINERAKELDHNLNEEGNALILKCDVTMYYVEIYDSSQNYEVQHTVFGKEGEISLKDLPATGNFIVEVVLRTKIIVLNIRKREIPKAEELIVEVEEVTPKVTVEEKPKQKISYSNELNYTKNKKNENTSIDLFWIVADISNGFSSSHINKFANKETVDRFIKKNTVDLKTNTGKNNTVIIWEIYDIDAFLKFKRKNKDYYKKVIPHESYNSDPYYKTAKKNTDSD